MDIAIVVFTCVLAGEVNPSDRSLQSSKYLRIFKILGKITLNIS
jgi:hypothetical protein